MASLNGLLGSVDAVKHIFEGAQSAPLHPQRRLTITGQDGSETLLVLPVPPHHFFSYRRPGGDARGYQLVICGHLVSPEARVWLRQGIGDLHGREWEQQEEGGEEEAATEDEAATTLGREDEAEALINLAANLVSELQSHEYLFTTDVKNIAALVFVATFLSKMVPVTASFKSKEALQQALWRVVLAPWKAPPSSHVGHVMAAPPPLGSCPDSRPYLVSRQYISERRRNVLAVMVGLFQLPEGPRQEARDALCGLARGALGQAVAEGAILLQGDAGLEGVAIRINDDYTKVPLCPISSWRSLPPHEWKFHIRCDIFFLGLKHMVHQRRIFPNKDKNTEGARPLSAVLQKILDGMMVSTTSSTANAWHELHCELAGVGQKASCSSAPTGANYHGPPDASDAAAGDSEKCNGNKGRHYRPTSCPARMSVSLGKITIASRKKDALVATIAEGGESQCIRLDLSYLHNHSSMDLDMRRHTKPEVEAFLEEHFADHRKDASSITSELHAAWARLHQEGGGGPMGVPLSVEKVQRLMTAWNVRQYGPQSMEDSQDRSAEFFNSLRQTVESDGGQLVFIPIGRLFDGPAAAAHKGDATPKDISHGWVVVMILDFMLRVHEWLQQSGETVFVDGTANTVNDPEVKLVWMLAASPIGGLPLASIITNVNSRGGYAACFEAMKQVLPCNKAFFFRGIDKGPANAVTDMGCEGLGMRLVWPDMAHQYCTFHQAQDVAQWVKRQPTIRTDDRDALYNVFHKMLYWDCPLIGTPMIQRFLAAVVDFLAEDTVIKYPVFVEYLRVHYALPVKHIPGPPVRDAGPYFLEGIAAGYGTVYATNWNDAVEAKTRKHYTCFRKELVVGDREHETNNLCEALNFVWKHSNSGQGGYKAFNAHHLALLLHEALKTYFVTRILNAARPNTLKAVTTLAHQLYSKLHASRRKSAKVITEELANKEKGMVSAFYTDAQIWAFSQAYTKYRRQVEPLRNESFRVGKKHVVDVLCSRCTCRRGYRGAVCLHQLVVWEEHPEVDPCAQGPDASNLMRALYVLLAKGEVEDDLNAYRMIGDESRHTLEHLETWRRNRMSALGLSTDGGARRTVAVPLEAPYFDAVSSHADLDGEEEAPPVPLILPTIGEPSALFEEGLYEEEARLVGCVGDEVYDDAVCGGDDFPMDDDYHLTAGSVEEGKDEGEEEGNGNEENRKKRKADRQSSRVSVRTLLSRMHAALTGSPSTLDGEDCTLTAPSGVSPLCSRTLSTTYSPNTADRLFSCLTGVKKLLIGGGVTAEEEGGHSKKMFKRDMEVMEREVNKVRRGNNTTHPIRTWMMAKSVDYEEGLQGRQGDAVLMRRGGGSGSTKKRQARKSSGGGKSVLVAKKGETTQAAKTQKVRSRRTKQKHAVRYKDRIVSKMNGIITMKEVQKAGGHLGGATRVTTQKTGK